jgi:hypothetical protein
MGGASTLVVEGPGHSQPHWRSQHNIPWVAMQIANYYHNGQPVIIHFFSIYCHYSIST